MVNAAKALSTQVRQYAQVKLGAKLVGIATVNRFEGAPKGHHPCDFIPDAEAVVVLGFPIVRGLMRWGSFLEESEVVPESAPVSGNDNDGTWRPRRALQNHVERRCAYETINDELQVMSMRLACFLEEAGHESLYLPTTFGATHSWSSAWPPPVRAFAPFSHRHAAVAAGLGQFGRSNLLLTRRYGSRVRLASVLTTAPLEPDPVCETDLCGDKCNRCVDGCPAHAFGEPITFNIAGRPQIMGRFDIEACRAYYNRGMRRCDGQCMTLCPHSLRRLRPPATRVRPAATPAGDAAMSDADARPAID